MKTYSYNEIVEMFGSDIVKHCFDDIKPTNRVIYPAFEPEHAGKIEYKSLDCCLLGGLYIQTYWYLDEEDTTDYGMTLYDWEGKAEFILREAEYYIEMYY